MYKTLAKDGSVQCKYNTIEYNTTQFRYKKQLKVEGNDVKPREG